VAYRVLSSVPGNATASPDGRWVVAPKSRTGRPQSTFPIALFTIDGTHVRDLFESTYPAGAGGFGGWLADSSGVFVATEIPQRAPPLAIVELDGRLVTTELQLSHQMLSRDGKLIVAEQQEGCCAAITQREIRVARRDGTGTRTLATSTASEPQSISLLGVDGLDRAVYRDGTQVKRVPLGGGPATQLGMSPDYERLLSGSTSPDGLAIITRAIRDGRSYVIAGDRVRLWDDTLGSMVEEVTPATSFKTGGAPIWVGPHALLVRDPTTGALSTVDAVTSTRSMGSGHLMAGDVVVAYQQDLLLIVRGGVVVLMDLGTGGVRDTGLDLRPDAGGVSGSAIPSGGFLLSGRTFTYRIH
jgi:hypothetical protein